MAEQNQKQQKPQQDMNQLLKVRREKLANLQAEGNDPFVITTYDQTHHAPDIKEHGIPRLSQIEKILLFSLPTQGSSDPVNTKASPIGNRKVASKGV